MEAGRYVGDMGKDLTDVDLVNSLKFLKKFYLQSKRASILLPIARGMKAMDECKIRHQAGGRCL